MHVGSVLVFEGPSTSIDELLAHVESRLHLVPRYRQRLAFPPFGAGRPRWVDDAHFNLSYHVRHSALPEPGGDEELRRLAGRLFSQALDRAKPLWELWLVDGVGDGFALIAKTHHALVDGISGVDIATVLFDLEREPAPPLEMPAKWSPRPEPGRAVLFADALVERAEGPASLARALRDALVHPERAGAEAGRALSGLAALAAAGVAGAPGSPINVRIGPHRRFAWASADLSRLKAAKDALGGTVNDVVLTVVAGALRAHLFRRGRDPERLELKAMVPISVRADAERGALGNKVAAMWASLPVWSEDPVETFALVHAEMGELKESGQAVGATVLTGLSDFAPPTIMSQAARLQSRLRFINLVVTNVPGPQYPLYLLGRRMVATEPMVPLAENLALGIAIMSYDGKLFFGLNGDYEAMADIAYLASDLRVAIATLAEAAGLPSEEEEQARRAAAATAPAPTPELEPASDAPPMAFSMPRSRPGTRSPRRDAGRARRST